MKKVVLGPKREWLNMDGFLLEYSGSAVTYIYPFGGSKLNKASVTVQEESIKSGEG